MEQSEKQSVERGAITGIIAGTLLVGTGISGIVPELTGFVNAFGLTLFFAGTACLLGAADKTQPISFPAGVHLAACLVSAALVANYAPSVFAILFD